MEKGELTSEQVEILERIARNLPIVGHIDYGIVATENGPVYIAVGKGYASEGSGQSWHGVWAVNGVARTLEIRPHLSLKDAQQQLLDDACWFSNRAQERKLYDGAKFHGG